MWIHKSSNQNHPRNHPISPPNLTHLFCVISKAHYKISTLFTIVSIPKRGLLLAGCIFSFQGCRDQQRLLFCQDNRILTGGLVIPLTLNTPTTNWGKSNRLMKILTEDIIWPKHDKPMQSMGLVQLYTYIWCFF